MLVPKNAKQACCDSREEKKSYRIQTLVLDLIWRSFDFFFFFFFWSPFCQTTAVTWEHFRISLMRSTRLLNCGNFRIVFTSSFIRVQSASARFVHRSEGELARARARERERERERERRRQRERCTEGREGKEERQTGWGNTTSRLLQDHRLDG